MFAAVALHPEPDDFCRELSVRGLHDQDVAAVCIVTISHSAELRIVGRYGPENVIRTINDLIQEVEGAIREKNSASHRLIGVQDQAGNTLSVSILPSTPMSISPSALLIFYKSAKVPKFEVETEVALAFACEMYCSPNWGSARPGRIRQRRSEASESSSDRLTSRQSQVLQLLAEGKTNDRIARMMNYSVATVKNDISAIFQYLRVDSRRQAVREAEKMNLITPPPRNLSA